MDSEKDWAWAQVPHVSIAQAMRRRVWFILKGLRVRKIGKRRTPVLFEGVTGGTPIGLPLILPPWRTTVALRLKHWAAS